MSETLSTESVGKEHNSGGGMVILQFQGSLRTVHPRRPCRSQQGVWTDTEAGDSKAKWRKSVGKKGNQSLGHVELPRAQKTMLHLNKIECNIS